MKGLAQGHPQAARELNTIGLSSRPDLLWSDLSQLGHGAQVQGHLTLAAQLFTLVKEQAPDSQLQTQAKEQLAAMRGQGTSRAARLEFLSHQWLSQATDPALLLAMTGAGWAYRQGAQWTRLGLLRFTTINHSRLIQGTSALGGFALEVPGFVLGERFLKTQVFTRDASAQPPLSEAMGSAALVLGALKLGGFGSRLALKNIHYSPQPGVLAAPNWWPLTSRVLPQVGMYSGILLGHSLDPSSSPHRGQDHWVVYLDGLATLLQFNTAGALLPKAPRSHLPLGPSGELGPAQGILMGAWGMDSGRQVAWASPGTSSGIIPPHSFMAGKGKGKGKEKAGPPQGSETPPDHSSIEQAIPEGVGIPDILRGKINPAFWLVAHEMPAELQDWLHLYWDQVFQELGKWGEDTIENPLDLEAMLGHSLARVWLIAPERLGAHQDPAKLASLERSRDWIQTHMDRNRLGPEFHRIIEQFELGREHGKNARWLWNALPAEIKGEILLSAQVPTVGEIQESPVFLARALAQTVVHNRNERLSSRSILSLGTSMSFPEEYIENYIDHLDRELSAGGPKGGHPPYAQEFMLQFRNHFDNEVAQLTRGDIVAGLNELNAHWQQPVMLAMDPKLKGDSGAHTPYSWAYQDLQARGESLGESLGRLYSGLLAFSQEHGLITGRPFGYSETQIREWRQEYFSGRTWEVFREIPLQGLKWDASIKLVRHAQALLTRWGEHHVLIKGLDSHFTPGAGEYPLEMRLEHIRTLIHLMNSAHLIKMSQEWHPAIQARIQSNTRHFSSRLSENHEKRLARALAMALAQSNGALEIRPGFRSIEFWDTPIPRDHQSLGWQALPPMERAEARQFQRWFPALAGQIQGEDHLKSFATRLSEEVANVSGQRIFYDRDRLPEMVDLGLMEDNPMLRHDFPLMMPYPIQLRELGRGIGNFLRLAYQDIFLYGELRDWVRPEDFDILPHDGGYMSRGRPPWLLFQGVHAPYVRMTLNTHDWFFNQVHRWGGEINPLYGGFAASFYSEGLSETQPLRLKLGARSILDKMEEGG